MRRVLALLLGCAVLLPILLLVLILWPLGLLWRVVVWLWQVPILPDDPPEAASDVAPYQVVRVSERDLWWAGTEDDWQARKH